MSIFYHRREEVLRFIKAHPGYTQERLIAAFGCDIGSSARRLVEDGLVIAEYLHPGVRYFPREKKNV